MSIGGGDGITLHKITQCADIKRQKNMDPDSLKMCSGQFKGSKKSWPPQNVPRNGSLSYCPTKKNVPQFLKQRDINSYFIPAMTT
jgi:hypothetical protein